MSRLCVCVLLMLGLGLSDAAEKPNIVLIMADDLGFEAIGANGCEDYKTPNIDKMAANGMRFLNCFANPLCTPSRVKIMTGLYNVRNYQKFGTLPRSEKTFAHTLKAAGYATCIAGKWQLGKEVDSPRHFGFDQACLWQHTRPRHKAGTTFDSRFENPQLEINGVETDFNDGEFGPDICADFVCDFITTNKDKPFFVYYPMILTHCPFIPTPGTEGWDATSKGSPTYKGDAKYFKAMDEHMDGIVGRIQKTLVDLKIDKKTLVLFMGDNGTDRPVVTMMNGKKIAGGKGSMTDHGTRVPLIVSFPGTIKGGGVSDELVDFTDIFPTLCEATGTALPRDRKLDGVSLWDTLRGKSGREKPWAYIWYSVKGGPTGAVIARNKTHVVRRQKGKKVLEFFRSETPYEWEPATVESLGEEERAIYKNLREVVTTMDATRPGQ